MTVMNNILEEISKLLLDIAVALLQQNTSIPAIKSLQAETNN